MFHNFDTLVENIGEIPNNKINPRCKPRKDDRNLMIHALYACAEGDLTELRRLLLAGVSPNTSDYDHRSLLQ